MVKLGINIIPSMPVKEVIETAVEAEKIGYEYLILADEGSMQDVYVTLGALARETKKMKLSPCTNGYTRHPAVTAAAMATLHELSEGRSFLTLIAGGSLVLNPMKIARETPLGVARDTVEIARRLWSGETVSYEGERFGLSQARLTMGKQEDIPIWIAPRGDKMCKLTGELADGAMLMVKADLGEAFKLVDQGNAGTGRKLVRAYIDRIAYTPEMIQETAAFFPHVVVDTPARQLKGLMSDEQIETILRAVKEGGHKAAEKLITFEMLQGYKIAGTPEECSQIFRALVDEHRLDVFILNIVAGGLEGNLQYLRDVYEIVKASGRLAT
ncbi:MAG: LLM class flavin-dependent oxidoreductase [Anaerolineae bacterium]|nr:LLM class flavin-dependent oxidoreductase [Anaerolineae bacterium]